MKVLAIVCRVLLGLMFVVFGLNGFFHFIPLESPPPDSLPGKFMGSVIASGWMPIVWGLQVVGGILVLLGVTAPIGLVILGPIIFNILLFHLLMVHGHGITAGLVAAVLEIVLIYAYRPYFAPFFTAHARAES